MEKLISEDCHLIRDIIMAMKMLIVSSSDSPYRANLTEEQTNLIRGYQEYCLGRIFLFLSGLF